MAPLISQIISHLKTVPETPQNPPTLAFVPIPVDADSVSLASDIPHSEMPPTSPRDIHSAPLVLDNDGEQHDFEPSDMAKMPSPQANTIDGSQQPTQALIGNRGKSGGGGGWASKTLHVRRHVFLGVLTGTPNIRNSGGRRRNVCSSAGLLPAPHALPVTTVVACLATTRWAQDRSTRTCAISLEF
ncbi:hypothetical protein niasHS_003110 [Heterodera schachtii]|uniref:Uncharacterized protein n=1 Tax=Heterodera schachtii TaxID=97005 RepID=A0ABD2KAF8_HETSC